jgi:hypothetical protein
MLCDRRDDEPALFVAVSQAPPVPVAVVADPAAAPAKGRPGRRRRSEAGRHPAATLELFSDPVESVESVEPAVELEPVVEPEPVVDPAAVTAPEPVVEPEPVVAREPEPDEDEVPAMLRATSPLLARAFAATGHQRSVLTQRTDEPDADG